MKLKYSFATVTVLSALLFTACKKQEPADVTTTTTQPGATAVPSSTTATVDTSEAERQFANAEPDVKSSFESAAASVRAGNYSEALTKLQQLASNVKLTDQQKQAVRNLLAQLQEKGSALLKDATHGATNVVNQAGDAANKAVTDLKKSISK